MIKMEERFAALIHHLGRPACMISGMGGPKTTELQRGCRNLPETPMFGSPYSRGSNTSPPCLRSRWDSGSSYALFAKRQARKKWSVMTNIITTKTKLCCSEQLSGRTKKVSYCFLQVDKDSCALGMNWFKNSEFAFVEKLHCKSCWKGEISPRSW